MNALVDNIPALDGLGKGVDLPNDFCKPALDADPPLTPYGLVTTEAAAARTSLERPIKALRGLKC